MAVYSKDCRVPTILAEHDIPHLIAGGLAVQEHGYFRVTLDADIIVPDALEAAELLTGDLSGPFARVPGFADTLEDKRTGIQINFLPAAAAQALPVVIDFLLRVAIHDQ